MSEKKQLEGDQLENVSGGQGTRQYRYETPTMVQLDSNQITKNVNNAPTINGQIEPQTEDIE